MLKKYLSIVALNDVATGMIAITVIWYMMNSIGVQNASLVITFATLICGVVSIFLGSILDQYSKSRILKLGAGIATFILVIQALLINQGINHVYVWFMLFTLLRISSLIKSTAQRSIIRDVFSAEEVPKVIRKERVLVDTIGLFTPLLAAVTGAISIELSILLISLINFIIIFFRLPNYTFKNGSSFKVSKFLASVREGISFKWKMKLERNQTVIMVFLNIFISSFFPILIPAFIASSDDGGVIEFGLVQSSIALFSWIAAAYGLTFLQNLFGRKYICTIGICIVSISMILTMHLPFTTATFVVMGFSGFGLTIFRLNGNSHRALAFPNAFKGRFSSLDMSLGLFSSFIGMLLATLLISNFPVSEIITAYSIMAILLSVLFLVIPGYSKFMSLDYKNVEDYYQKLYPELFKSSALKKAETHCS